MIRERRFPSVFAKSAFDNRAKRLSEKSVKININSIINGLKNFVFNEYHDS